MVNFAVCVVLGDLRVFHWIGLLQICVLFCDLRLFHWIGLHVPDSLGRRPNHGSTIVLVRTRGLSGMCHWYRDVHLIRKAIENEIVEASENLKVATDPKQILVILPRSSSLSWRVCKNTL